VVGVRTGLEGALILGLLNEGLVGVRGLEEREGDWVGERVRGSEVNRDVGFGDPRVDGVRMVAGYNVPELEEAENATAYAGDLGRMKLWVGRGVSSSLGSAWASDSLFSPSSSSLAQLNPRPIEVTPQLFPTPMARL